MPPSPATYCPECGHMDALHLPTLNPRYGKCGCGCVREVGKVTATPK